MLMPTIKTGLEKDLPAGKRLVRDGSYVLLRNVDISVSDEVVVLDQTEVPSGSGV